MNCEFCTRPMRMRYPGEDPENGPARPSCGVQGCDNLRQEIEDRHYWYSLSIDDAHEEAIHEEEMQTWNEANDPFADSDVCPCCGKELDDSKWQKEFDESIKPVSSAEANLDEQADNSSNEDL